MPIEKPPKHPLPQFYFPPLSIPYRVRDGDSWVSLAEKFKTTPAALIEFNFKTRDTDEVNWYLRRNVGCKEQTSDGKNWMFSSSATPGLIYRPLHLPPAVVREAPVRICPEELNAAKATLRKSQAVADTIVGRGATSDMPYWFARLYQYITLYEIEDHQKLKYPCFTLHFIPIFYDSYFVAADAFMKKASVPPQWREHFNLASLVIDSTQVMPYANAVTKSLVSGVAAHIKVDMPKSLAKAYRSFSTKYSSVPPFDTYRNDFFKLSIPVFEKVRATLVNELVNRVVLPSVTGRPGGTIDPNVALKVADILKIGLNIKEIYDWRDVAWSTAKKDLEGH